MNADDIIRKLSLEPHAEGGWYCETWIGPGNGRPSGSAIYFMLKAGEVSHWHRLDADELWHFYAGAPLELRDAATIAGPAQRHLIGPDLLNGQQPQRLVRAGWWQSARSLGDWTLLGCTVVPAFGFDGFELAPPGFDIPA